MPAKIGVSALARMVANQFQETEKKLQSQIDLLDSNACNDLERLNQRLKDQEIRLMRIEAFLTRYMKYTNDK